MIAPILDEIADEYQGKLTVAKLKHRSKPWHCAEIWHPWYPDSAACSKNGEVAATKVGALSKGQLKEFLDANLA
ncbi:thioredoxin 1 [Escherichia coli]|uniref:Thioredoxin 1 n=1 Tax=Escherichia coli TaxID=562 RepID=A0A376L5G3_ECOLX|nr:thioredoxin 1 [Escherichia coli]